MEANRVPKLLKLIRKNDAACRQRTEIILTKMMTNSIELLPYSNIDGAVGANGGDFGVGVDFR